MPDSRVKIGEVVGFHGLRGAVKVRPATENPDWVDQLRQVWLELPGKTLTLTVEKMQLRNPRQVLMHFEGYPDLTAVERELARGPLYADRSDLPEPGPDEFWADDLVGLAVVDAGTGKTQGTVVELLSSGAADYLEIRIGDTDRTTIVPFQEVFFPGVDLEAGTVTAAGLTEFFEAAAEPPKKPSRKERYAKKRAQKSRKKGHSAS